MILKDELNARTSGVFLPYDRRKVRRMIVCHDSYCLALYEEGLDNNSW